MNRMIKKSGKLELCFPGIILSRKLMLPTQTDGQYLITRGAYSYSRQLHSGRNMEDYKVAENWLRNAEQRWQQRQMNISPIEQNPADFILTFIPARKRILYLIPEGIEMSEEFWDNPLSELKEKYGYEVRRYNGGIDLDASLRNMAAPK